MLHPTMLGDAEPTCSLCLNRPLDYNSVDANTKESKDTVLESDDFPLHRLFDNNL